MPVTAKKVLRIRYKPGTVDIEDVPHRRTIYHPSHLTWGYIGSGPQDLAFNVLLTLGYDELTALDFHREFCREFILDLPQQEGGEIDAATVAAWLELRRRCVHPAFDGEPILGKRCTVCGALEDEIRARQQGHEREIRIYDVTGE